MDETHPSPLRDKLLAEFDQEWANIERICAGLSEGEMLIPTTHGEWSVKDILAHISSWEKILLDRLSYVLTGQQPQYPAMSSWDDIHAFNARMYAENKDRPLTSVVIEFRNLYRGVMTVIEALSDEQLNQPYTYDFPQDNLTLLQFIRASTTDHYREHCMALARDE